MSNFSRYEKQRDWSLGELGKIEFRYSVPGRWDASRRWVFSYFEGDFGRSITFFGFTIWYWHMDGWRK